MGQDSRVGFGLGKMKRICQIQSTVAINFVQGMPERMPVCLSIDGENFVMYQPRKLVLEKSRYAGGQITVLRGPNAPLA